MRVCCWPSGPVELGRRRFHMGGGFQKSKPDGRVGDAGFLKLFPATVAVTLKLSTCIM